MSLVDIKQTWLDPDRTQRAEVKRPLRAGIGLKANGKYTIYSGELRRMPRRWQLLGRAGRGAVHFLALVGRSSAAVSCRPLLYSVKHYILHYSSFTQPEAAAKRRGGLILIHRFLLSLLLFRNHRSLLVPSHGYPPWLPCTSFLPLPSLPLLFSSFNSSVRSVDGICADHLTVESYTVFICQQSYLLLFRIPPPIHFFYTF